MMLGACYDLQGRCRMNRATSMHAGQQHTSTSNILRPQCQKPQPGSRRSMPLCSARLAAAPIQQRQPLKSWQCHRQKERRRTHQYQCQATSEGPGQGEPEMTKEEIAGLAEAFKKMLEGGIGEDLPDMPQGGERRGLSSQEAIDQLQMGTWRLKGLMDPPFEALESQIEGMWRELLRDELSLFPMPQELKYCDSLDPNHEWPSSYRDADWPQRGEPAYPRMQLENRCYESRVFRRLHMELVHRQDSIQVIHCVMFPRLEFDLPILSMDMVGKGGGPISLAVIDPCPVSLNRSLPQQYYATVKELQERYGMATNRATPEWGKAIFSDLCVILRPQGPEDVSNFLKYAIALTRVHLQLSKLITPVTQNRDRRLAEIREAHARYSAKQLENDKTTRVLEAGFGKEFCNRYMRTVVFDEVDDLATA